eukprot:10342675-Ditylum_brightwellii.AAC.1
MITTSPEPNKRPKLLTKSDLKRPFFDEYSHCFQGPPVFHVPSSHPTKARGKVSEMVLKESEKTMSRG